MGHILAFTIGNTKVKGTLFDEEGREVSSTGQEIPSFSPHAGWHELDPMAIWEAVQSILTSMQTKKISRLGIGNQRDTIVVWDKKTGKPVYPAILGHDLRMSNLCFFLKGEGLEELFRSKTGLFLDPFFCGTKLVWILDNVDHARTRSESGELVCGTLDSWLIWHLTEGDAHLTDATNASRTLFYNIHTRMWDKELLDLLDIPKNMLPDVIDSKASIPASIPIHAIAGNIQSLLCDNPGDGLKEVAYACFDAGETFFMPTGKYSISSSDRFLSTLTPIPGEYMMESRIPVSIPVHQLVNDTSTKVDELRAAGSRADDPFLQSLADHLGIQVMRAEAEDPAALGIAILAGLKRKLWEKGTIFSPSR